MSAPSSRTVLVAEPAPLMADVFDHALTSADYDVVRFTAPPSELLAEASGRGVALLVVGPSFGRAGLPAVVPELLSRGVRTVLVSPQGLDRVEAAIMLAGASGYLSLAASDYSQVAMEVGRVMSESSPLHPDVVRGMLQQWRESRATRTEKPVELTPREIDVVRGLGDGLTTRLIAARLGLSVKTVEAHKSRLFAKLGAKNSSQALKLVSAQRLV